MDTIKTMSETTKFDKNQALNGLLTEVERTGGIKKESADAIRRLGREFREYFELSHDRYCFSAIGANITL